MVWFKEWRRWKMQDARIRHFLKCLFCITTLEDSVLTKHLLRAIRAMVDDALGQLKDILRACLTRSPRAMAGMCAQCRKRIK